MLPKGRATRFGLRPESVADQEMLMGYVDLDKSKFDKRQVTLRATRTTIASPCSTKGWSALLDELDRRGMFKDTVVIVTADHGEEFDEHGLFNHGYGLYLHEVHVPLLILAPTAPAGVVVETPVSFGDLPATIVDLLGFSASAPFPGGSLAAHWSSRSDADPPRTSPAMSEVANPTVMLPKDGLGPTQRGFAMSLVIDKWHYIRDTRGGRGNLLFEKRPARTEEAQSVSRPPAADRLPQIVAPTLGERSALKRRGRPLPDALPEVA